MTGRVRPSGSQNWLGGYPALKKWLGYRQASRQGGRPLDSR
jgi:hypothetical protein